MKFGPVAVSKAAGAILAHSVAVGDGVLKKGLRLEDESIDRLEKAGIAQVVVARLEAHDVHEDEAAGRLAGRLGGAGVLADPPFTGRANLHAARAGILRVDRAAVDCLNARDPAITLATLPDYATVEAGRLVATLKIIPYALAGEALTAALEGLDAASPALTLVPFRPLAVGVVSTLLPSLKASVVDKTLRNLEKRLEPTGARIAAERRVPHDAAAVASAVSALAAAGIDLIVLFGASAVVDRRDVLPAGLEAAGGRVVHFGMPVDPGNLLLVGAFGDIPVIGAPGCARSPAENGFDWVLRRCLAGLPVERADITAMGVGGLLMEIVSRPQPRDPEVMPEPGIVDKPDRTVAALVLAAGRSSRMGAANKLLATVDGEPLVRIAAKAALASRAARVTIVTGHESEAVSGALDGLDVAIVENPDFAAGLSTSLSAGIDALGDDVEAVLVMLGDMPRVGTPVVNRLIAAFDPDAGAEIVVPTFRGKRGNPVLWARRFFPELKALSGDVGARDLIGAHADRVVEVEIGVAVALDVDTPEALAAAGGRPAGRSATETNGTEKSP